MEESAALMSTEVHSNLLPRGRSTGGRSRSPFASPVALKVATGVTFLALWEGVVRGFAPSFVATPIGIAAVLSSTVTNVTFLTDAAITLQAVITGLLIAVVLGTVIGLTMGRIKTVENALRFYVEGLYNMPMIAVLPLLALWLGHGPLTRLVQIILVSFLSVALNVADGARGVSADYLEVARSFRTPRFRTLFEVVLLASVPYALAGVRIAVGRALTAAVIAGFYLAIPGFGYYILFSSRSYHENEAFVAVLVLVACGVGIDRLISLASRRLMPWLGRE